MTKSEWRLNWRKTDTRTAHGPLAPFQSAPRSFRSTTIWSSPTMFEGRLPQAQAEPPKVVETVEGHEVWEFDGKIFFQVGLGAVVGDRRLARRTHPILEMRRVLRHRRPSATLDINGVWASVNFPSRSPDSAARSFPDIRPHARTPVTGRGTTGSSTSGTRRTRNASSPQASPFSATRNSGRPNRQRGAGSGGHPA